MGANEPSETCLLMVAAMARTEARDPRSKARVWWMISRRLLEGSSKSECFHGVHDKVESLMRDGVGIFGEFFHDVDSNPTVCPGKQN